MATDTSINAYRTLNPSDQYEAILNYLRRISPDSSCIADIAVELGMEKSSVSGRMNELKNWGDTIEYVGKRPSRSTGKLAMHWRIKQCGTLF